MQSMDDMMSMNFDELRATVNPEMTSTGPSGAALSFHGAVTPPAPVIPDHQHELDVYFSGPGAKEACASAPRGQLAMLPPHLTQAACAGKRDFIHFEDLDDAGAPPKPDTIGARGRAIQRPPCCAAAKEDRRIVLTASKGDRNTKGMQVCSFNRAPTRLAPVSA